MAVSLTTALFWACAGSLVYAYAGYPALLAALRPTRRPSAGEPAAWPSVSVIVAAHNEERCIEEKIANLLGHDYPEDRLEVLVVSDASTDATEKIVAAAAGPRVRLLVQPVRGGKNLALNRGAEEARGDVLVFTDANAMLVPGALRRLVAPFADPAVGLVSGQGLYADADSAAAGPVSNAYVRYESFTKQCESALGFLAAADGALYALRRALYRELGANQVHDLHQPIDVALDGYRSAFVPEACTVEPPSHGAGTEYARHVRMIAQGFAVMASQGPRLARHGRAKELWMLVSHRLLRWCSSLFLVGALGSSLALGGARPLYRVALAGQLLFYACAAAGAVSERLSVRVRLLAVPYYFCVVSAAGVSGFLHYLRGRRYAVWSPTGARSR